MSRPWMKYYPRDWRADPRLRMCSLSARGLWADLLGYMHEAVPYGHLLIDAKRPDITNIAALVGRPLIETRKAMTELSGHGVFSVTDDGTLYSRRMVRDAAKEKKDRENGKTGGNPILKGEVNPPDKAQIPVPERKTEANASGADAPRDIRRDLFDGGLKSLAAMTGKTPDSCRSIVGKWLKSVNDEAIHVLGAIEDAERNNVADPIAWINRSILPYSRNQRENGHGANRQSDLASRIAWLGDEADRLTESSISEGSEAPPRLLSDGRR